MDGKMQREGAVFQMQHPVPPFYFVLSPSPLVPSTASGHGPIYAGTTVSTRKLRRASISHCALLLICLCLDAFRVYKDAAAQYKINYKLLRTEEAKEKNKKVR